MAKKVVLAVLLGTIIIAGIGGYWLYLNSITGDKKSKSGSGDNGNSLVIVEDKYTIEAAFPNLTFAYPVGIYDPADGTNRLYVVEKVGRIKVFENITSVSYSKVFLNLSSIINTTGEQGLLGLAFHPDYSLNGYFYVDYSELSTGDTVLARYKVNDTDTNIANISSAFEILRVTQPFPNHNGGQIAFGPNGYLYFGLGDGGGGDPLNNSQDLNNLQGSILRIDVDLGSPYSIPIDNPFNSPYQEEIYAYGFRNPWRFSFDFTTGNLWLGDVGQGEWEEIDIVEKGKNYGWNAMEGNHSYPSGTAIQSSMVRPVFEYRNDGIDRSITGGFVYRGSSLTELIGKYIYGDFLSGRIWALDYIPGVGTNNTVLSDTDILIASFGVDSSNELYICQYSANGKIFRLLEN